MWIPTGKLGELEKLKHMGRDKSAEPSFMDMIKNFRN